ncbi:MAG TPA: YceI family protein [Puia sp.]|jgi:polyisoprenoid-binding protein YceI|nr:YceI family protein [Puia sp.]
MKTSAFILGLLLATNWTVDTANAKVEFSVHGPFGTVNGTFTGLQATIRFDPNDLAGSSLEASIDAKTVSSGIGLRNHHLRTEEQFLNTDKYPRIAYKAGRIEKSASGYKAIGSLTIKDVTKPVEIPFTFTSNGNTAVFKGEFTFRREDFNIGKEGGSIGDMITIHLEVPVKKQTDVPVKN